MKKIVNLLLAVVLGNATVATAQLNWEGKEATGKPKWYNLEALCDEKKYTEAVPDAVWLLQNTPQLTKALYQYSAKVFQGAQKKEKDAARKVALQDSALWVWDKRIEYYGEEAKCLNKKGKVAYKYLVRRKENTLANIEALYALYSKVYDLNKDKMYLKNATYYFRSSEGMFKTDKIDKAKVLTIYGEMIGYLDRQELAANGDGKEIEKITKQRDKINGDFDKNIDLNCEEIKKYYGEDYTLNPTLAEAKKINTLLQQKGCTKDELFIVTNDFISEQEPSAKRFAFAAYMAQNDKDYARAYQKFEKALELETSDSLKSAYYFSMAQIKFIDKDFPTARKHARASIASKSNAPAYGLIGDLYMSSGNLCKSDDPLQARSIYIAAYNQYKAAGNSAKMTEAKQYFPELREIFERGKKEGDEINTGCWIGETVKLTKK